MNNTDAPIVASPNGIRTSVATAKDEARCWSEICCVPGSPRNGSSAASMPSKEQDFRSPERPSAWRLPRPPGEKQWESVNYSVLPSVGCCNGGGRVLGVGDQSNKPADVLTSSSMSAFCAWIELYVYNNAELIFELM